MMLARAEVAVDAAQLRGKLSSLIGVTRMGTAAGRVGQRAYHGARSVPVTRLRISRVHGIAAQVAETEEW